MSVKIYSWHGNPRALMVQILAEYSGEKFQFVNTPRDKLKTEEFKKVHALGKVPVIETPEGTIFENTAILGYFARKVPQLNLLGRGAFENAQVVQWQQWLGEMNYLPIFQAVFGENTEEVVKSPEFQQAKKELMNRLQHLNNYLVENTFLAGHQVTVADIQAAVLLSILFSTVLDEGYRKGHQALVRYYKTIIGQPQVSKYMRQPFFTKQDWTSSGKGGDKQQGGKKQKQKEQPKKQEKKVEKKEEAAPKPAKNPLDALPPSSFNLFDFKTFIVNEKDKKKAVQEFWKQFDPQGYSIWHIQYDKYTGEGIKLFLTSNLKDSFLQRCDQLRKHAFGTFGVYGEEGNYEIEGVWVWRGTEIPQELKDLPMFEYYRFHKLDHTKESDRALLEESWTSLKEDEDTFRGMVARDVGYYK